MEQTEYSNYQKAIPKLVDMYGKTFLFGDPFLPMLSNYNVDQLLGFQKRLTTEILPAVNNPQGYGRGASPKTLETWDIVKIKLGYLCDSWGRALGNPNQESSSVPSEAEMAPFAILQVALASETMQASSYDVDFDQKTHEQRLKSLKMRDLAQIVFGPTELAAYTALCALHQYSKKRGWTTDEGFGKLLGESELKERVEIYQKYKADIRDKLNAKDTSTRLWHH